MKIRLLGTATSQGVPVIGCDCAACTSTDSRDQRLRAACMVEVGGKRLVIDIGPDFRRQMLDAGGKEIHAVLVTHEHNDHVAGIDDVRPFNFKYEKHMPLYAMKRVVDILTERYDYIFLQKHYPGIPQIQLHTVRELQPFMAGGIEVLPIPVMHGKLPILGFRIGDFAYLTDVKTIPEEALPHLQGLEVLVMSCLQEREHYTHIHLDEAVPLAQKIGAKKTFFMHFSHYFGPHERIDSLLPSGIRAGWDGMELTI